MGGNEKTLEGYFFIFFKYSNKSELFKKVFTDVLTFNVISYFIKLNCIKYYVILTQLKVTKLKHVRERGGIIFFCHLFTNKYDQNFQKCYVFVCYFFNYSTFVFQFTDFNFL